MATNPLELSDEDFLKQPAPDGAAAEGDQDDKSANEQQQNNADDNADNEADKAAENQEDKSKPEGEGEDKSASEDEDKDDKSDEGEKPPVKEEPKPDAKPEGEKKPEGEGEPKKDDVPSGSDKGGEAEPPNYENFYKEMMAPFKANGKTIELKSPEEARQLMQMGANYTRKMQDLAPARKVMTTLQNNGLLDESKLNFLISLDKGDPEAIKKLIIDKGIDPLDIDTKVEPAYQEGNYQASDDEIAFRTQMEEVGSTDEGKQTLAILNDWDQASQELLWRNPEIMTTIHEQRNLGVYDLITAEMDRQKTLGQLSQSIPFIQAYKTIGDQLADAGAFKDLKAKQPAANADQGAEKPNGQVIAERAAKPKPTVNNNDQAGAASPTRGTPGKAREVTNFLAMSDDEFLKAKPFEGRV